MDRKIFGAILVPGAVYIAIVLEACYQTAISGETIQGYRIPRSRLA